MPRLRTVWQRLGEQTVAEVTTTPLPELTDILLDLAASLAAQNNPASRSVASSRAV